MRFKNKTLNTAKQITAIAVGLLLNVMAWQFFILPHHITGGGATGIAVITYYATDGAIPVSATYLAINIILLLIAFKIVDKQFTLRTILGVGFMTLWFAIPMNDIFEHIFGEKFPIFDPFMSVIIAGVVEGFGMAIAFTNNGSTGGSDIIAKIINQYKDITLGRALIFIDVVIICSSIFVPESTIESLVYGLLFMIIAYESMDIYINGIRQSVQFFIYTKKPDEIAEAISSQAHRGVTVLTGEGWYTKSEIKIVTVLVRKQESSHIFAIIKSIDRQAFISQIPAIGVYGEGFDSLRK